jgi:hypothetical protein
LEELDAKIEKEVEHEDFLDICDCELDFQFVAFNCSLMPKMGKHMDFLIIYCFEFFEL